MNGKIKIMTPDIGEKAVDERGGIFSYIPDEPIVEFVYIHTKPMVTRGKHYHKHFDEYIMITDGDGIYYEALEDGTDRPILVSAGVTIHIPKYTPHTFFPLTEVKAVSFLTAKFNDVEEPITPWEK